MKIFNFFLINLNLAEESRFAALLKLMSDTDKMQQLHDYSVPGLKFWILIGRNTFLAGDIDDTFPSISTDKVNYANAYGVDKALLGRRSDYNR